MKMKFSVFIDKIVLGALWKFQTFRSSVPVVSSGLSRIARHRNRVEKKNTYIINDAVIKNLDGVILVWRSANTVSQYTE